MFFFSSVLFAAKLAIAPPIAIPTIESASSEVLTTVATKTPSAPAVLTIKTLRNLIPALSASTPSVTCLIVLVAAVWPEPHPVIVVAISNSAVNFLKVLAMAKD